MTCEKFDDLINFTFPALVKPCNLFQKGQSHQNPMNPHFYDLFRRLLCKCVALIQQHTLYERINQKIYNSVQKVFTWIFWQHSYFLFFRTLWSPNYRNTLYIFSRLAVELYFLMWWREVRPEWRERGAGARDYTGTTHNTLSVNLRSSEVGDLRVESEDRELERGEPASLL